MSVTAARARERGEQTRAEGHPVAEAQPAPHSTAGRPARAAPDGPSTGQGRPEPDGELRDAEEPVAQPDEPVEEDRLVETGSAVEVRRHPVAAVRSISRAACA